MTQTQTSIRLATTAIAAALAISTTPLMAQQTPTPDTSAGTPATATPDPLAPAPATDTSATPTPDTTVAPETTPSATERTPTRATRTTATRAVSRPAATTRAAPARVATAAPKAAPAKPAPEPVPAHTAVAPTPAPPAAVPAAQPAEPAFDMNEEALPIAGAGAVGLLALVGAGLALRRRRRRREELAAEDQWAAEEFEPMAAQPVVEPVPATAAIATAPAPRHDPVDEQAPTTALPEGFDLSRFGPHVQAAYRGPTPDNPSLSLKYRLRKATALDQRERTEAEAKIEPVAQKPDEGGFMLKGDNSKTVANAYSR